MVLFTEASDDFLGIGLLYYTFAIAFLPRDAMHKRGLCRHAVSVCVSVRLSVTFVHSVKTNKYIFKNFFTVG